MIKWNIILAILLLQFCNIVNAQESNYYTETRSGTGKSVIVARQKALASAKAALATRINGEIENISKTYIEQNSNTNISVEEILSLTRITSNTVIKNTKIENENTVLERNGTYTVTITLKIEKSLILNAFNKQIKAREADKKDLQNK